MVPFSPATVRWFARTLGEPTPVQSRGWPVIQSGAHALLVAPTGSGKTLAAFLAGIDRLVALPVGAPDGVRVLYVSPLKALVHDIRRNLDAPLAGILAEAPDLRPIRVDQRTGDTPARDRARFGRHPADILVTTPESLFLLLGSAAREALRTVETVIVDEVHAIADQKRGVHLALTLERLDRLCGRDVQRVGLSATVRPVERVADWLGGGRDVTMVDASRQPNLEITVEPWFRHGEVDGEDASFSLDRGSGWPAAHQRLLELVLEHRSTILFTNSRRLCERLAQRLNELAGEDLVRAHHGSVAPAQRVAIESALKAGSLRGIVATGTLELGIDMAAVDLVVLVQSPGSVAKGLQRVGRAGHQVGAKSLGRILPRHRIDLLESAVIAAGMAEGALETLRVPRNCLDVLAQHVVALACDGPIGVDEVWALVRRTVTFRELPRSLFDATLDMLAGRWKSELVADLVPRITWDRAADTLTARKGAPMIARLNAGTIPDQGMFPVFLAGGPRVGELFEEMVFESSVGDVILLGASSWRIEEIGRDRVTVRPAPGEPGRMPFWRGESVGRPIELGWKLGAFVREISDLPEEAALDRLVHVHHLDPRAARQVLEVLAEQRAVTGVLPTDRAITVERFADEIGDQRVTILTPFGARIHGAWAVAIEARVAARVGAPVQTRYGDDGLALRIAPGSTPPAHDWLIPDPEEVEDLLLERLTDSALFAARFRENAARALLLPRNRPGKRTPLWAQRIRGNNLLAAVRGWPDFPLLLETTRECLQDVWDLPGLVELFRSIRSGLVKVDEVETPSASPFARSLTWGWVSEWLYQLDGPKAERRAQVLTVDRAMLREVLGEPDWAAVLDAETLARVEAERSGAGWPIADADALHDLLRRLGDATLAELEVRAAGPVGEWLRALEGAAGAVEVAIAGERRWIAAEDAALYRDALGVKLPPLPASLLVSIPDAFASLVLRFARAHGPFRAVDVATRFAVPTGTVELALQTLSGRGEVQEGTFRGGSERLWCANEVVRQLRRAAVDRARAESAAVSPAMYASFLTRWHGLDRPVSGLARLREALVLLEGAPLSVSDLESVILPMRVSGYRPAMLDELGARGEIVWLGRQPLGDSDGRVVLLRRERLDDLAGEADIVEDPVAERIVALLERRGASFLAELGSPLEDVMDAIWKLVWAGRVTNDTFHPLRSRAGPSVRRRVAIAGGRWSLVRAQAVPTSTLVRAEALLGRYGIVGSPVVTSDALGSGTWPALRALEEAGRARRGWYVEGLGGVQVALPGAVDALRASAEGVVILAATDPAQPYGSIFPWPLAGARRAGARVALVDGEVAFFLDRGGKSFTFAANPDAVRRALGALPGWLARLRLKSPRIERVDGVPVRESAAVGWLREAGFRMDPRSAWLDVPV